MTEQPKTMLDDILVDLAENLQSPAIVKAAKLIGERFCLPEEQVRPYILAVLLQLSVATDSEFLADPTNMLRRLDNMGYNVARAGVAAEQVGWDFMEGMPNHMVSFFGDFTSVTEFCSKVTKGPRPNDPDIDATEAEN
jgi:hypothetical protein